MSLSSVLFSLGQLGVFLSLFMIYNPHNYIFPTMSIFQDFFKRVETCKQSKKIGNIEVKLTTIKLFPKFKTSNAQLLKTAYVGPSRMFRKPQYVRILLMDVEQHWMELMSVLECRTFWGNNSAKKEQKRHVFFVYSSLYFVYNFVQKQIYSCGLFNAKI